MGSPRAAARPKKTRLRSVGSGKDGIGCELVKASPLSSVSYPEGRGYKYFVFRDFQSDEDWIVVTMTQVRLSVPVVVVHHIFCDD